jgi:protein TonB
MLLQKVDPAFPRNTSGMVRIGIIVNKDGQVRKATFVEGDPELADAAVSAVRRWTYRPTISNWESVEVRSEVVLNAGPAQ